MGTADFIGRSFIPVRVSSIDTLDTGKCPADWVEILAAKGVIITERNLRERANRIGARIKLGRNMLITVGHMEKILEDSSKCPSNLTSDQENGGRKAVSYTKARKSPATTSAALELYQSKAPGSGARTRKRG